MNVLIIEDEGIAARRLSKLVEAKGLKVLGHCKSISESKDYLQNNKEPDLYFMDIHLSDGLVFELLQDLDLKSPIIFTTAYDQYAIKAFKQNSIDYLLKPIDDEELSNAIEKCKSITQASQQINLQELSQMILNQKSNSTSFRDRIRVKIGDRIKSISLDKITHIYSKDKISYMHTNEGRSYPIDYSLEKISHELDPKVYFKTSRSEIVNIEFINDVISYSNSRLKIKILNAPDHEIIVARDKVKAFKDWLG